MKVGIVGCGYIGEKRANELYPAELVACADIDFNVAHDFATKHHLRYWGNDYRLIFDYVDTLFICTPNKFSTPIAIDAINAGKHVLIEKPGGTRSTDIIELLNVAHGKDVVVRIGYNHRYHPAIIKAMDLIYENKAIGDIMYIDALYGHGGAHLERSDWRTNSEISGGGDLIEKGCHLIDLASFFFKQRFVETNSVVKSFYRKNNLDDNAWLILESQTGMIASLHTSCTEWRNTFHFSIHGTQGNIYINGLGGSYGTESITINKLRAGMIKPEVTTIEYLEQDQSWGMEILEFDLAIKQPNYSRDSLWDALHTLIMVEGIYEDNGYDYKI
jgi:predicted dehydrogenase